MWLLHFPTIQYPFSSLTTKQDYYSPKFKDSPADITAAQPPAAGGLHRKHAGVILDGNRRAAALHVPCVHRTDMPEMSSEVGPAGSTELPGGLLPDLIPNHVGIIMDGNRRWAVSRGLTAELGHQSGSRKIRDLITLCAQLGIKVLSVFAFSTENWLRPKEEVGFLMRLFKEVIDRELDDSRKEGVRVSFIGDKSRLPPSVQELLQAAEETTKENTKVHVLVAMNYSGRSDILQACKSIARKVKDGELELEDIDEEGIFDQELQTSCAEFPNPDLLIRTSGEIRVSNFMLWQLAYTELFFLDKNFPDFGQDDFIQAIQSYQKRHRRFGGHKY